VLILLVAAGLFSGGSRHVDDVRLAMTAPAVAQVVQAPALAGAQPISSRDRVYTADQVSNTVTVINPKTDEVLGTIPLGHDGSTRSSGRSIRARSTCTGSGSRATAASSM